ncbi:MAG TPA: phospho-sugar mutase [Polyangiaceae bacterium]|nr:phospho-sugar mutase [Polyangiaceae bacterium]
MDREELLRKAQRWMAEDPDPRTVEELRALLARPDLDATDLADRFAATLEFGTAGLRGVIGAGPNRMNRAVVARATWGVAQELLASVPKGAERGVVVGGDARRMSRELAEDTAAILAAAGIRVVLFREPVPTPLVGFTVKRLGAAAGVVVTASHNPPEYNGYKVYWENAAQIVPPTDARIAAAIERAPAAKDVPRPSLEEMQAKGLVSDAPASAARAYLDAVRALAVHPGEGDRSIRIVYTPMHGVGDALVRAAMSEAGFANVTSVPEQQKPDGAFPTVAFPNPEEKGAMDLSFALAKKTGAHLVLANDPDADRLAVAVPEGEGWLQLTGNQVGVLLGHYLLTEKAAAGPRAVIASIVSSPLLGRIAATLGVRYEETLTGFKWIANRAMELEREGFEFVFGYEEALGYCVGSAVRDKDGISAAVLAAEVTAVLRARGRSLQQELEAIARRWGVFTSTQVNVTHKGAAGLATIRQMMERLRASPPARIASDDVLAVSDYETRVREDLKTGATTPLTLPRSNVLTFELASGSRVIARPSGTEPKAKFYFDVREEVAPGEPVSATLGRAQAAMKRIADAFSALASPS